MRHDYPRALRVGEEALAGGERVLGPDHPRVVLVRLALAEAHLRMGRPELALPLSEGAVDAWSRALGDDHAALAHASLQLGEIYHAHGRYEEAERRYERVREISGGTDRSRRKLPGRGFWWFGGDVVVASSLVHLARLYTDLGDPARAQPLAERALLILENSAGSGDLRTGVVLLQLAHLHAEMGDPYLAAAVYENARAVIEREADPADPRLALLLAFRARLYREEGDLERARLHQQRAVSIASQTLGERHPGTAAHLLRLAEIERMGSDLDAAEGHAVAALSIAETSEFPVLQWEANGEYALIAADLGQLDAAIYFGKRSVNLLQAARGRVHAMGALLDSNFLAAQRAFYDHLIDWLADAGRLPEAQEVLRMVKEQEYFEFIRRGPELAEDPRGGRTSFLTAERDAEAQIQVRRRRVGDIGRELDTLIGRKQGGDRLPPFSPEDRIRVEELRSELALEEERFRMLLAEIRAQLRATGRIAALEERNLPSLRTLRGTLRRLGEGAVVLHYVITPETLHILLTSPSVQVGKTIGVSSADLNRAVLDLRNAVSQPAGVPVTPSAWLYDLLIAPIADDLAATGAQTLMLSLDGALRYVPFAALWNERTGRYLVEDHATVLYSEVARNTLEREAPRDFALAAHGVQKGLPGFPALPAVSRELDRLVRVGPGDTAGIIDGEIHLDDDFTREALRDSLDRRYPLIHVASHFVFRPGIEEDSFLLLGDGTRLTLGALRREAWAFDAVDLLTLSACETALVAGGDGAEIEGFGALAQRQGALAVMSTLWSVADESTSEFMERFYSLRVGVSDSANGLSKAAALRQAQLGLLASANAGGARDYSHPYFWAPFILAGNWR